MPADAPQSVGLRGDGDDLAALEFVEEEFGVTLDDRDVSDCHTAGDVFRSLLRLLPPAAATDPTTWTRFSAALAKESGVDPRLITEESPLFETGSFWRGFGEVWLGVGCLWLIVLLTLVLLRY